MFGLKQEAVDGLRSVLRPTAVHIDGILLAARFCQELGRHRDAHALAAQALRVGPSNSAAVAYAFAAAMALAAVDPDFAADARDAQQRAVERFGEQWMKGVVRATEDHTQKIRQLAWRTRAATEGEVFKRFLKTDTEFCEEERERAMAVLDRNSVPEPFRSLLPLALRYGVGDDFCRARFIRRTPRRERVQTLRTAEPHLDALQTWVSSFEPGALPPEAAAFFWLLEALEEMRVTLR